MYAGFWACRDKIVENLVESVEFHPENRLERLSFELSPQSFQLVPTKNEDEEAGQDAETEE